MTGLEFLSATIGQLVWPTIVLLIVVLLREPIKKLASSPRLKMLKAGPSGVEVEFREELTEVQQELSTSPTTEESEDSGWVDKSGLDDFKAEMTRLAAVSPRSVVMETHARLERLIRGCVNRNAGETEFRPTGMRSLIREGEKQGWISPGQRAALDELAYLRNRVAHEPDEVISKDTALWYAEVASDLATSIHFASGRTTSDGPFL